MSNPQFEFVDGGRRLVAHVDLDQYVADRFEEACRKLSDAAGDEVSVDLSGINYICSTCLGHLVVTSDRCKEFDKTLRLKVPKRLVDIFDLLAIRDLIDTEVVG